MLNASKIKYLKVSIYNFSHYWTFQSVLRHWTLFCDCEVFRQVDCVKYLELVIDYKLSWKPHSVLSALNKNLRNNKTQFCFFFKL